MEGELGEQGGWVTFHLKADLQYPAPQTRQYQEANYGVSHCPSWIWTIIQWFSTLFAPPWCFQGGNFFFKKETSMGNPAYQTVKKNFSG